MAIEDRRTREREAQRGLITSAARALAESEGWDAVTTRRLAADIEYSQPVIYKHFASLGALIEAIALDGFRELAEAISAARCSALPDQALAAACRAYLAYAAANPAVYEAMFGRSTTLPFASTATPAPLSGAYDELRQAVVTLGESSDTDTLTEVFWASLHGLFTLARQGRLREGHDQLRIEILIAQLASK